jgi:hypothetical protein
MKTVIAVIFITSMLLSGCAASYKPVYPSSLIYNVDVNQDSVGFGYRYDVLGFKGNKRYAKKETKSLVRVVAMKIENRTEGPLTIGQNLFLYSGKNMVHPMEPESVRKSLKQSVAIYLLYSLLWFNDGECDSNGDCKTTAVYPVGIPIAIGNMVAAGSANKQFLAELTRYNVSTKPIEPGETVYALVGIPDNGFQPLSMVVKK